MATLTINFTAPSPTPYGGYKVKYRAIGTTVYTTITPNPVTSPVVITGVTPGVGYEGTVQSDCGNGSLSPELSFVAYASNQVYALYGNSVAAACSASPIIVYLSNTDPGISPGVTVYTNPGLTSPLVAATHIMSTSGAIYPITGGVVQISVGDTCGSE